ncbi:MAG: DHH family phosphoesterase [Pirellulales bacterium]
MSIDWPRFCELIHQHQNYLLISHVRPDCDALGSELGMLGILEHLGKRVRICNGHPTPQSLSFIDPENRIGVLGETHKASDFDDVDCILILDTSAWAQLGSMGDVVKASKAKKMILDHHLSEDDLGAEAFKNVKAEAAGRLVMEAASELKVPVTARIAMPLFAAIATDTGWFRFGSASSYTYRMAADMIDSGRSPCRFTTSFTSKIRWPSSFAGSDLGPDCGRRRGSLGPYLCAEGRFSVDRCTAKRHRRCSEHLLVD